MLGLPKSTEFNKKIPKQKFYENITVTPTLKRVFIDQIKVIYWRNKIAPTTLNISPGREVMEVEVLEIKLNSLSLDESVLRQIDKEIPYHILFLLEYSDKYQAWIGYKESANSGKNAFKVNRYYHTEWMTEEELPLKLQGLNVDSIYENYVRQVGRSTFENINDNGSLKEAINLDEKKKQMEKQIALLKTKIQKEKQLNKQMEMNKDLKELKTKLNEVIFYGNE